MKTKEMKSAKWIQSFLRTQARLRQSKADKEWNAKGHTDLFEQMRDEAIQLESAATKLIELVRLSGENFSPVPKTRKRYAVSGLVARTRGEP